MAWIKSLRFAFPIVCYSHLVLSLDSPLGDALAGSSHPVHLGYSAGLAENLDHAAPCKTTNLHPGSLDESFRDDFQARYPYETTPYEGILFYEEAVIKRYLSSLSHTSGKRTGTQQQTKPTTPVLSVHPPLVTWKNMPMRLKELEKSEGHVQGG
ncbi:hypothetical protein KEM48_014124 [Puccinia striiformis f. sp. tritici PST-130]|nr:hypothetical protein KEM48_014124 [Puccinia striiformis f. sp. tritici PST-130]